MPGHVWLAGAFTVRAMYGLPATLLIGTLWGHGCEAGLPMAMYSLPWDGDLLAPQGIKGRPCMVTPFLVVVG